MKFSATLLPFALLVAGSVEGHAHIGKLHRRGGPSATFTHPTTTRCVLSKEQLHPIISCAHFQLCDLDSHLDAHLDQRGD